jgi:osmotically-inducible protein OsmY
MRLAPSFLAPSLLLLSSALLTGCFAAAVTGAGAGATAVAQERPVGEAVDDAGIYLTIKKLYAQEGTNHLFANIGVEVVEGRVLLTGNVQQPDDAIKAVEYAWRAEGVREVINEIQVRDKTGITDYARDAWISTQIKSRLLFTKGIRSINYNIETMNAVVYLLGLAQNQQELDSVTQIARTTQYVKQVVSYVRLKDDPMRRQAVGQ